MRAHESTIFNGRRSPQSERRVNRALRARVTDAFQRIARGIDGRTAQQRSWDFFRSGGTCRPA
jgi:hypothetical protein